MGAAIMKSVAVATFLSLSLILSSNASAITIPIDPGVLGDTFSDKTWAFNDLNTTPFDGSSVNLDFTFADMKHLEATASVFLAAELGLTHALLPSLGDFSPDPSGFLSDELGNPILGSTFTFQAQNLVQYFYTFEFGQPPLDQFIFHDVHLDITLPVIPNYSVTGANLRLYVGYSPPSFLEVGEWAPAAIPEPSTIVFMGLGLVGLGYAGRRKLVS
jgi:hypothetical protein